jgi:hypothetical protein
MKAFNIGDFYILLWVLHTAQGFFFENSLLSMAFYIPFLLLTLYLGCLSVLKYKSPTYIKALLFFMGILTIYGVVHAVYDTSVALSFHVRKSNAFFLCILSSLGPIAAFYVLTIQGKITERTIRRWFFVFLVVSVIAFRHAYMVMLQRSESFRIDEFTNNTGYQFLGLLPLLFFFYKKQRLSLVLLVIIFYFIFTSWKRGAIFLSGIILIWYFYRMSKVSVSNKYLLFFLTVIFLVGAYFLVEYFYSTSDYFLHRLEQTSEGNSSSRNILYQSLMRHLTITNSAYEILFGNGADATIMIAGDLAHEDWLELMIDCGLLGVFSYVVYWGWFIKTWLSSKRNDLLFSVLGACFLITFAKTFFSMSFSSTSFFICLAIGYCVGTIMMSVKQQQSTINKHEYIAGDA